jgi:hypothetical protein
MYAPYELCVISKLLRIGSAAIDSPLTFGYFKLDEHRSFVMSWNDAHPRADIHIAKISTK